MAIGNKRYGHVNAHEHKTIQQTLGGGHLLSSFPPKLLGHAPHPPLERLCKVALDDNALWANRCMKGT